MRYVIIGNSVAAVNAIEAIRGIDPEGEIAVVSDEELFNYSRPLLSYYLGGRISAERLPFRDRDFYEGHRVDLVLGKRATSIDVEGRVVGLEDGQFLPYDRLLLSVGGRPIIPPMEGYREDLQGVFTFLKWRDAKGLIAYI
ncbi:MAG: NAD(P)/FAD-dependent oxidoreductase, partial [Deltaproteobacteria bacterium]